MTKKHHIYCHKSQRSVWHRPNILSLFIIALAILQLGWITSAWALDAGTLPQGGQIVSGSGNIETNNNTMTINQVSDKLIGNWNSFSIGQNATVRFNQPNSSAIALNRILGSDVSQIAGQLSANGRVVLINPNGVLFSPTARVDVGGLVASTLSLADEDFLAGQLSFNGNFDGAILNQGRITTGNGGIVAFVAPQVDNEGIITTPQGVTALLAGQKVSLDFNGDGLINYQMTTGAAVALAENSGTISATGGLVVMSAQSADDVTQAVVNNGGIITAQGLSNDGGRIILNSGTGGATTTSGNLDVSASTGNGGHIELTGRNVAVRSGARLDARGTSGGGKILIGGDWQGSGDTLQAQTTTVETETVLDASATVDGDGGTIVSWSDINDPNSRTIFHGTAFAKGGTTGGDGGHVEASGYAVNQEGGRVDTTAPFGETGLFLIDPSEGGGNWGLWSTDISSIGTTNVTISTANNLILRESIWWSTPYSLSLIADNINFDGFTISHTGTSNSSLFLSASTGITGTGSISASYLDVFINQNGNTTTALDITSAGGSTNDSLIIRGNGALTLTSPQNYSGETFIEGGTLVMGGNNILPTDTYVIFMNDGGLNLNNFTTNVATFWDLDSFQSTIGAYTPGIPITSNYGNIALGSGTLITNSVVLNNTFSGIISGTGSLTKGGTGNLTLAGINTYSGDTTISAGTITNGIINALSSTTDVTISGATWDLANYNNLVATIAGDGDITLGSGTLSTNGATDTTFSGIISGTGNLTKDGIGTLTLSGNNTYSGVTNISDGTLAVTSATGLGTSVGTTIINNGATLHLNNVTTADDINLSGTGYNNNGALMISDSAGTTGTVTATTSATIEGDGGGTDTLTLNAIAINNNATLTIGAGDDLNITSGAITANAPTAGLIINTAGTVSLGAIGSNMARIGAISLTTDDLTLGGDIYGSDTLIIKPYTNTTTIGLAGGAGGLNLDSFELGYLQDGFSAITIGGSSISGKITSGGWAVNDNLTLLNTTGGIELTGAINGGSNQLTLNSTGTISSSGIGSLQAGALVLANASSVDLNSINNNVGTLTANGIGDIAYVDSNELEVGTLSGAGTIAIETRSGNLTLSGNIVTTDTTDDAIILNAGSTSFAGTAAGGNIIISGNPTITTGTGGRATLYSGSISGSTGLTTLIGSGSGNFRYNSGEITANYTSPLGSGNYAIYREQPNFAITAIDQTMIYGDTNPTFTFNSNGVNGDTVDQVLFSDPTFSIGGSTATSGSYTVGDHVITPSVAVDQLGYALSYNPANLSVSARDLILTGLNANNKIYDDTTMATFTGTAGVTPIVGDIVTLNGTSVGTFTNSNAGANRNVIVSGLTLTGADASNYNFLQNGAPLTADITARTLNVTYTGQDKFYDGTSVATVTTTDDRLANESLTINWTANFADPAIANNVPITVSAISLSGGDAINYQLVATSGSTNADILTSAPTNPYVPPAPESGGGAEVPPTTDTSPMAPSTPVDGQPYIDDDLIVLIPPEDTTPEDIITEEPVIEAVATEEIIPSKEVTPAPAPAPVADPAPNNPEADTPAPENTEPNIKEGFEFSLPEGDAEVLLSGGTVTLDLSDGSKIPEISAPGTHISKGKGGLVITRKRPTNDTEPGATTIVTLVILKKDGEATIEGHYVIIDGAEEFTIMPLDGILSPAPDGGNEIKEIIVTTSAKNGTKLRYRVLWSEYGVTITPLDAFAYKLTETSPELVLAFTLAELQKLLGFNIENIEVIFFNL